MKHVDLFYYGNRKQMFRSITRRIIKESCKRIKPLDIYVHGFLLEEIRSSYEENKNETRINKIKFIFRKYNLILEDIMGINMDDMSVTKDDHNILVHIELIL